MVSLRRHAASLRLGLLLLGYLLKVLNQQRTSKKLLNGMVICLQCGPQSGKANL